MRPRRPPARRHRDARRRRRRLRAARGTASTKRPSPSDHANTLLCTAYGRNIQNALRKAHAQAGFQYVRFHGIFNDDVGVYSEDASGAPIYDWSRVDAIYDAVVAAGMRPLVEISFTPGALASDAKQMLAQLWYNGKSPNISPPTGANGDWSKWTALMARSSATSRTATAPTRSATTGTSRSGTSRRGCTRLGDDGYFELYRNTVAGLLAGRPGRARGRAGGLVGRIAVADRDADRADRSTTERSWTSSPTTATATTTGCRSPT